MTSSSKKVAAVSFQQDAWSIAFHPFHSHNQLETTTSSNNSSSEPIAGILLASISLAKLFSGNDNEAYRAFVYEASTAVSSEATTKHVSTTKSNSKNVIAKAARVALADYTMRTLSKLLSTDTNIDSNGVKNNNGHNITLLTMEQAKHHNKHSESSTNSRRTQARKRNLLSSMRKKEEVPYVLERTDCYVADNNNNNGEGAVLQLFLQVGSQNNTTDQVSTAVQECLANAIQGVLSKLMTQLSSRECFSHIASVVLQRQLRAMLQPPRNATDRSVNISSSNGTNGNNATKEEKQPDDTTSPIQNNNKYLNAVAFIADGSLLPRKSGRSVQPMQSPPAVPFNSPQESEQLTQVVEVYVGEFWRRFLKENDHGAKSTPPSAAATVTLRGMIIPQGVTLIVGGGYHGKSTILQALSYGVYDKVPGDGRELCVTHSDAVSIRAEDGRYVNNVNVSAFINSIPSGKTINGASISSKSDTTKFSTMDASGSTSQAANVIEALECQASALLVDEDVSAANFMARDGRMRAMIMDEPITPLLYRVNGLYLSKEHNTSTVVVVGGVGEWLDVADAVVLMKNYVAYDGLKKARSVSYQFSYGHVQYAGRGVVHRLPWEVKEEKMLREENDDDGGDDMDVDSKKVTTLSPLRRRPLSDCLLSKFRDAAVHMPEGSSSRLWLYSDTSESENDMVDYDEDDGIIDMSKCSQLVGNASEQLYGCGICILWLMQESQRHKDDDIFDLLDRLEDVLEYGGGMNAIFASLLSSTNQATNVPQEMLSMLLSSHTTLDLYDTVGFCYHPRRHEVAMALTRMRGMKFEILPEKPKEVDNSETSEEEAKRLEEESKKKALAELWANRRKRGINR
eukprot:CAMPEP_0113384906 /NCGR_PEP_ID=MMETSP0013_2-20120614/7172_1 /TAXON_ID=2843 ORGANISM="Skeletonema costatum, Strain 1716" /NCGR_SAMPLE_ID=MMETSP0013_2 /ASSEMBLY_ACC=CAM_ASM_000158 /LENGTH=852 /DNA_ID=CAMNT_0000267605 /DNA_START=79 /DNA_END=2637 /DNA_ORIENTATION=- /assembly_acc=CAM_ASM_000158